MFQVLDLALLEWDAVFDAPTKLCLTDVTPLEIGKLEVLFATEVGVFLLFCATQDFICPLVLFTTFLCPFVEKLAGYDFGLFMDAVEIQLFTARAQQVANIAQFLIFLLFENLPLLSDHLIHGVWLRVRIIKEWIIEVFTWLRLEHVGNYLKIAYLWLWVLLFQRILEPVGKLKIFLP